MIVNPGRILQKRYLIAKEEAKRKFRVWQFRREAQKTYKAMEKQTNIEKIIRRIFK